MVKWKTTTPKIYYTIIYMMDKILNFIYYHYYVDIIMTNYSEFNDFTLFDIFIKNGLLYLIVSINNVPISIKELLVRIINETWKISL